MKAELVRVNWVPVSSPKVESRSDLIVLCHVVLPSVTWGGESSSL